MNITMGKMYRFNGIDFAMGAITVQRYRINHQKKKGWNNIREMN